MRAGGADFDASLSRLTAMMAAARDDWWVIGSAAVALHGADPGAVADIDVLLSEADAARILPDSGVAAAPGVPDVRFVSRLFGTCTGAPLPIEFMAGLHRRAGTGWQAVRPQTRVSMAGAGWRVFVPDRAELASILRSFGRAKDLRRAAALAAER